MNSMGNAMCKMDFSAQVNDLLVFILELMWVNTNRCPALVSSISKMRCSRLN